ncbi:MAG: hypothetical protein ACXABY_29615 [Candidatus Thorarchaeota archaeon]|jgi:hypothetical protein
MMLWTVYYTIIKTDDNLIYSEPPAPIGQSIGTFYGGNCDEVVEGVCEKIGHPIRFDKDLYELGSGEYIYTTKDPSTLVVVSHHIQVAPVGELIKLKH